MNVRSAFLHMAQDEAAALVVGVAVFRSALSLVWETITTLMEASPEDVDVEALARVVAEAFSEVRLLHVHVWQNGPGQRLLTGHVTLTTNLDGAAIGGSSRRSRITCTSGGT